MAQELKIRRGSNSANDAFTGALAELSYDTQTKELRTHDGATQGGHALALKPYDTVALLIASTAATFGPMGQIVKAQGFRYEVANPLSEPVSTDNPGGYHLVTAGGVKLRVQPEARGFDVRSFGAIGNGVANDTVAVLAAVAAARAADGPSVYFPAGRYNIAANINGSLSWPVNAGGLHLDGDGFNSTFLIWTGASDGTMIGGFDDWTYGFSVKNMALQGHPAPFTLANVSPNTRCIAVEKVQNLWVVENVRMYGWGTCIWTGVHAEMGKIRNAYLGYSYCAIDSYGHNSDLCEWKGIYTIAIVNQSIKLSGPRQVFEDVIIVKSPGWSNMSVEDIKIGWRVIRPEDIGKSAASVAGTGQSGNGSVLRNIRFERTGVALDTPYIVFENFDPRTADNGPVLLEAMAFPNQTNVPAIAIRDKRIGLSIENTEINRLTPALLTDEYSSVVGDANHSAADATKDVLRWISVKGSPAKEEWTGRRAAIRNGAAAIADPGMTSKAAARVITALADAVITKDARTGAILIGKPTTSGESIAALTVPACSRGARVFMSGVIEGAESVIIQLVDGATTILNMREVTSEALRAGLSIIHPITTATTLRLGVRGLIACKLRLDRLEYASDTSLLEARTEPLGDNRFLQFSLVTAEPPTPPAGSSYAYLWDNGGVIEKRAKFSNGTVKVLANWT